MYLNSFQHINLTNDNNIIFWIRFYSVNKILKNALKTHVCVYIICLKNICVEFKLRLFNNSGQI